MQPILDLRQAGADAYTYSLSAAACTAVPPPQELFNSTERCLYDAGRALQNYFESVLICYEGVSLGAYPVAWLVRDPLGLFDELTRRLTATFRPKNRVHPPELRSRAAPP